MIMVIDLHPSNRVEKSLVAVGMYPSLKPLPKPPIFLSAGRNLRISRLQSSFHSAYREISFYTQERLEEDVLGKIVTRSLSRISTAPSIQEFVH